MLKRKCKGCGKKIEKKYNFCPYCGFSFKQEKEREDFGMLGRDDFTNNLIRQTSQDIGLPFGLDKMVNHMIKQLNKELGNMDNAGMPRGFKIQISTGKPRIDNMPKPQNIKKRIEIPQEELERRKNLPREEAGSNVRRLADRIIYEIYVPGVRSNRDIIITKLENSIEIKAYSKDKCYYKIIPLKVEIIGYYVRDDILFLEFKG